MADSRWFTKADLDGGVHFAPYQARRILDALNGVRDPAHRGYATKGHRIGFTDCA